jgi:alpha-mannosidase
VQPGDHHFRFSLLAHESGWPQGMRYGLQANHELIAVSGVSASPNADLPPVLSFAAVSESNVLISAIKKAEDDESVVLRCYEIEGRDSQPNLSFHFPLETVAQTNLIEEDPQPVDSQEHGWQAAVGHHAIETFKLKPGSQ